MPLARESRLINRAWKFAYGVNPLSEHPDFDDAEWFDIGIPHSFGIPYFMETEFYVGTGTYRHWFSLREEDTGNRIALEFQGVFQDATIYVNGTEVGRHRGGYTAFEVDISDAAQAGDNLLAVRVSNEWDARLAPRAGEHVFNGGIYRDVAVTVTPRTRFAWHGSFVRTVSVENGFADIAVDTELSGYGDQTSTGHVVSAVLGAEGKIAEFTSPFDFRGVQGIVLQDTLRLADAPLWSITSPTLLTLVQTLLIDGEPVDEVSTEFGIRTIEFTSDRGFFLNGEHVWITGANVHQDHAGWSDAVTHRGIERDVRLIKDCGMNAIRGSHYPHHEHFASQCDRLGLLFWSELAFWGIGGGNAEGFWNASAYPARPEDRPGFEESCLAQLREMIRVNRNHPSIITWSTGNEVFFSDDDVIPEAKALTERIAGLARELDPSRPVAVGGAQRRGFDTLADVAGYNGDGASLYPDPGIPNIVSEYGSVIEDRPGAFEGRFTDGTGIAQQWRSGVILWCGFHHGSIVPEMGRMGFIDYYRVPLRSWYWYRENLRGIPAPEWPPAGEAKELRLTADRYRIATDGTDDVLLSVEVVDANGNVVESESERSVLIEAVDGPALFPTGDSIVLNQANRGFIAGRGAIEARSYFAGITRFRARSEGLPDSEVDVVAVEGPTWDGRSRSFQVGPPSVRGLRTRGNRRALSEKRPVFSSSFAPGNPPGAVTDPMNPNGWRAEDADDRAWVQVDLEGLWAVERILLRFADGAQAQFVLSTVSSDGVAEVVAQGDGPAALSLDYEFEERIARAVRVDFAGPAREVLELRAEGW